MLKLTKEAKERIDKRAKEEEKFKKRFYKRMRKDFDELFKIYFGKIKRGKK